jgi:hypothetical protein
MKYIFGIVVKRPDVAEDAISFYDSPDYENVSDAITAANAERDRLLALDKDVTLATVFYLGSKDMIVWQWKSILDKINDLQS